MSAALSMLAAVALWQASPAEPSAGPMLEACDHDSTLTTRGILVCEFFYKAHGRKPSTAELQASATAWDHATARGLRHAFPHVKSMARTLEGCEASGYCVTVDVKPW